MIEDENKIRNFAKAYIYKCKENAYGNGTNASNDLEGDYGTWEDWENVLISFGMFIYMSIQDKEL